jgi:hypothetical protein
VELEAWATRVMRECAVDLSPARLEEILLTDTMPKLANAMRGTFERVQIVQTGGSGDPGRELVGLVSATIGAVADAARAGRR